MTVKELKELLEKIPTEHLGSDIMVLPLGENDEDEAAPIKRVTFVTHLGSDDATVVLIRTE